MLRLLSFLVIVGLAIAGAVWLANHPGDVIIQWLGWRVDTTVPVILVATAVLVVLVMILVRVVLGVLTVPGLVGRFRSRRALRKGLAALAEAEGALLTHDAAKAAKKAAQAQAWLPNPQAAVLIQAEAALLREDLEGAQKLYEGLQGQRASELAALRGLLDLAERRHDKAQVRDLAARAVAINERAAWAVRPLLKAAVDAQDWDTAEKTLKQGRKHGVFAPAEFDRLSATLFCAQADAALVRGETYEVARLSKKAVAADETFLPAVLRYAQSLANDGNAKKAAALLVGRWKAAPTATLAAAYLSLWAKGDALQAVSQAEALAEGNPDHLESRLLVAEAALRAELWGQARSRLKPLVERGVQDRRIALLMAQVEERERNNPAEALRWFKKAAEWEQSAPAQAPAWVCGSCHAAAEDWSVHCPACHDVGTIVSAS